MRPFFQDRLGDGRRIYVDVRSAMKLAFIVSCFFFLQAELVSVESKEIESHYVLAREPIHKWNSSSDCYLLIEGVEHTLQVSFTENV